MNLVVIARRPEIAERGAATIQALTGRHPSRTIVVQSADPDGPSWVDARIEAHCVLPRADAPETCAETIHLIAGGEAGRHLSAIVTPLIIHDLPVTVWWPGEPPFTSRAAARPVRAGRSPGGRRLDVERRRARRGWASSPRCRDDAGSPISDFAPGPPIALARGDRLDLRRSRFPPVPALAAADRRHVRDTRRDRRARARPTSSSRSTTSPGSPRGSGSTSSSR